MVRHPTRLNGAAPVYRQEKWTWSVASVFQPGIEGVLRAVRGVDEAVLVALAAADSQRTCLRVVIISNQGRQLAAADTGPVSQRHHSRVPSTRRRRVPRPAC